MSPSRLVRVVVRTEPGLHEALARIAQRLFSETQLQYSRAAVFRGLVAIGLAAISDAPHLAPLFRGVRVKRGRKPGGRAASPSAPADLDGRSEEQTTEDPAR
jgi:hypothetical protein